MIHEEICTYEVCKLAKEKGFDWDCPMSYNLEGKLMYGCAYDTMNSGLDMRDLLCHNSKLPLGFGAECAAPTQSLMQRWLRAGKSVIIAECAAPTQSLLQRWLREEKGYYVYPFFDNIQLRWDWVCREKTGDKWIPLGGYDYHLFDTYELALEDALKYALENLV